MARYRIKRQMRASSPEQIGSCLEQLLANLDPEGLQSKLWQLWQHWEMVMGPDLAELALPLGHHKDVLLVAACDNMVMQELQMQSDEILERVNAFMDGRFKSVRLSLPMDRNVLKIGQAWDMDGFGNHEHDGSDVVEDPAGEQTRPSGIYLPEMDPDSPVARCYARFAGKKTENLGQNS